MTIIMTYIEIMINLNINEIKAKGDSQIAQIFYLIHLTDWMSWFLSDLKKVDATEVDVISHLKSEMGKK